MSIYGYWIEPDGSYHLIENDYGHKHFLEKVFNITFDSDEDATEQTLEKGWIRVVNGSKSFMVDYRYIMCKKQLETLKNIDNDLNKKGYYHSDYILSYGLDYYIFNDIKQLLKRIIDRSC